jgi:ferric-dicitrate binding protein FerR (iron transport regulator)
MKDRQMKALLRKYLAGKCTEREQLLIEQWYRQETERRRTQPPQQMPAVQKRMPVHVNLAMKIAASLLLLLGAAYVLQRLWPQQQQWSELAASTHPVKVQLQDGTLVWLNTGARLRYPQQFRGPHREIELLTGEACFDVKQDPAHPFLVRSGSIRTRVLGTVFNVRAYRRLDLLQVTVQQGRVAVECDDTLQQLAGRKMILMADEQLTMDSRLQQWKKEHTDAAAISNWTAGQLLFNNERLDIIAMQLEHRYQVRIAFADPALPLYRITAGFSPNDTLNEVLEALSLANKLHYEIEGKKITFSKQLSSPENR